jgi:predicted dehydrogenase
MLDIGVGLVGISHPHTSGRLKILLEDPGVTVLGVADDHPVTDAFLRHFALPRRTTDEILEDEAIDAVLIHSKSEEMAQLAARALRAGKAVLLEKPAGGTVEDLRHLEQAARETGGICQVGYNFRFSRAVERTDAILADGLLGEIVQVRAHCGTSLDESATSHLNQAADMGGGLWVIGCHMVDLLLHHFGVPEAVNARVAKFDGLKDPAYREDAASTTMVYADKVVGFDFNSWEPLPWMESWEISIYGTNGVLHVGHLPARLRLFLQNAAGPYPSGWTQWQETSFPEAWAAKTMEYTPELAEIANRDLFSREVRAFLAAVRGEAPVAIDAAHALAIANVIDSFYASSAKDGAEVLVAPVAVA